MNQIQRCYIVDDHSRKEYVTKQPNPDSSLQEVQSLLDGNQGGRGEQHLGQAGGQVTQHADPPHH